MDKQHLLNEWANINIELHNNLEELKTLNAKRDEIIALAEKSTSLTPDIKDMFASNTNDFKMLEQKSQLLKEKSEVVKEQLRQCLSPEEQKKLFDDNNK